MALFTELKRQIDAAGLGKAVARCCQTTCLDFCDHGPSVLVEPEHLLYARVGVQDVSEIVDSLRTGQPVNRLLVDTTGPAKSDLG